MTATLRFGLPAPDDDEQVVLGTRWGTAPSGAASDGFFPFAVAITSTDYQATMRNMTGSGTEQVDPDGSGIAKMLFHPDSGLLSNGITDICFFNNGPAANTIHTSWPGRCRMIAGIETDMDAWFALGAVPNDNYATLDAIAADAIADYQTNPDVYGYVLNDDVSADTDPTLTLAEQAIDRVQALDVAHRPASPSFLSGDPDPTDFRVGIFGAGSYPCRWVSTGVKRAEGDFTRNDGTSYDWHLLIRNHLTTWFPGTRVWWWCQAHKLSDGSVPTLHLAYPTAPEIRKQTWEAIGSGATGLFWFIYQDNPDAGAEWLGLAHPSSRTRLEALAEMNHRLSPGIRQRLLRCLPVADQFTASGGGSADWLYHDYAAAFISTLYDATYGVYYCVVCNRATSTQSVTITSGTLDGTLRNLETGTVINVGGSVSLPALDGVIFAHVPSSLYSTMALASDNAVEGARWLRDNGETYTTLPGNGCYQYNVTTDVIWNGGSVVDDHDGNYGEAHKLHGLCLRYLRTHDAGIIPDIEAQAQWHVDIEQAAVTTWGSAWQGSAPYWYWTGPDGMTENAGGIVGSGGLSVNYTAGMVRRWTSIDQMHMVAHGLYAYLWLLRNETAITANTTLVTAVKALVSRMATFETANYPTGSKSVVNLNRIVNSLTPTVASPILDTPSTFKGQLFDPWQVDNTSELVAPSSNVAMDNFFAGQWSSNGTEQSAIYYLRGHAMDMLASDLGRHDVEWDAAYGGSEGVYPTGWAIRAQAGDTLEYATPRVVASNNGFSSDLHYVHIANSGARDGLSGRAAQRMIVLCLLALLDPTYDVPLEMAANGTTVLRSVPILTAVDQWATTLAAYLPEPTTNCNRFMAPMHLGTTGSHRTDVIDSAFSGYWMMAAELWHLVNSGADYTDYYPIGSW